MVYKLCLNSFLNLKSNEVEEARKRMGRYGEWILRNWWEPFPSVLNPEKRIEREGYVILEKKR